jgi:hypothetical protein
MTVLFPPAGGLNRPRPINPRVGRLQDVSPALGRGTGRTRAIRGQVALIAPSSIVCAMQRY